MFIWNYSLMAIFFIFQFLQISKNSQSILNKQFITNIIIFSYLNFFLKKKKYFNKIDLTN